jgi:hypothetical protein
MNENPYWKLAGSFARALLVNILGAPFSIWSTLPKHPLRKWPGILAAYYIGLVAYALAGIGWLLRLPLMWFYPPPSKPRVLHSLDGESSLSA